MMNNISLILCLLAAIVCACAFGAYIGKRVGSKITMANIAEGTHDNSVTRLTDAAITTRHLLYKVGSDGNHIAACGAAEIPMGSVADEATAAEEYVALQLLGRGPTKLLVASEAITAGEQVFTAASGKVQDLPGSTATVYLVGTALTAAAADGDLIEVDTCVPVKTVIA